MKNVRTAPLGSAFPVLVAVLLAGLPAPLPAAPYLVKDLNTFSPNGFDADLEHRGTGGPGISYFAAADSAHGLELWRSDGTPGGTERLTDICAGRCDSLPRPAAISVHAGSPTGLVSRALFPA